CDTAQNLARASHRSHSRDGSCQPGNRCLRPLGRLSSRRIRRATRRSPHAVGHSPLVVCGGSSQSPTPASHRLLRPAPPEISHLAVLPRSQTSTTACCHPFAHTLSAFDANP